VDLAKTLHVRSFLDHDRPYLAPARLADEASVQALYARTQILPQRAVTATLFLFYSPPGNTAKGRRIGTLCIRQEGRLAIRKTEIYARTQMADCVHLDRQGKPISPAEVFASLLEHLERWGDAIEGSFGLCVLEVAARQTCIEAL